MSYKKKSSSMFSEDKDDSRGMPRVFAGGNATPEGLGGRDDFAWAIASELEQYFIDQRVHTGKNAAWLFKRGSSALDRTMIRAAYSKNPERFRDGTGKQLTLAEFGRRMVRYFGKHSSWQYASSTEDVIGMFYDPVMLDECAKGLWRVYRERRARQGVK